jgi:hypothetical protein
VFFFFLDASFMVNFFFFIYFRSIMCKFGISCLQLRTAVISRRQEYNCEVTFPQSRRKQASRGQLLKSCLHLGTRADLATATPHLSKNDRARISKKNPYSVQWPPGDNGDSTHLHTISNIVYCRPCLANCLFRIHSPITEFVVNLTAW